MRPRPAASGAARVVLGAAVGIVPSPPRCWPPAVDDGRRRRRACLLLPLIVLVRRRRWSPAGWLGGAGAAARAPLVHGAGRGIGRRRRWPRRPWCGTVGRAAAMSPWAAVVVVRLLLAAAPRPAASPACGRADRTTGSNARDDAILVIDVGTSGVRGRGRAPRRHRRRRAPPRGAARRRPRPGLVEFDAARDGRRRPRGGARRRWPRAGRSTRSASPTSGPRRSCGTAPPASRSAPASAGRTCAPSAPASCCRPTASASPPTRRPPRSPTCSTTPTPTAPATSASAPSTPGSPGTSPRARCTSPTPPTPASPGCIDGDGTRLGRPACSTRCASPRGALPTVVDSIGRRRRGHRPRRRAADRRRSPATSRRRSSARAACGPGLAKITFGTGGMLDLRLGDERPRFDAPGRGRLLPDRRLAARRRASTWGVEAVMLSAGTNVEWLRDDLGIIATAAESHDVASRVRRHRRRGVRARAARARHARAGTTAPAARCSALTRGSEPAADRAGRARGRGPARRRPGRGGRGRHRPARSRRCASTAA